MIQVNKLNKKLENIKDNYFVEVWTDVVKFFYANENGYYKHIITLNKTNRSTSVKLFKKNGIATSVKASSIVKYIESMKSGE